MRKLILGLPIIMLASPAWAACQLEELAGSEAWDCNGVTYYVGGPGAAGGNGGDLCNGQNHNFCQGVYDPTAGRVGDGGRQAVQDAINMGSTGAGVAAVAGAGVGPMGVAAAIGAFAGAVFGAASNAADANAGADGSGGADGYGAANGYGAGP